jgi:hypothetical protein
VYQKADQFQIDKRKNSLDAEIRQVIADGEAPHVFKDKTEGMWLSSVFKNKGGKVLSSQPPTNEGLDYASKLKKLLASPPKKRPNPTPTTTTSNLNPQPKNPHPPMNRPSPPHATTTLTSGGSFS